MKFILEFLSFHMTFNRTILELKHRQSAYQKAFADFLGGLQKNINPSITSQESVEMLSQHIITKPVFEALFDGYSFVKNNPISVSMQTMLDLLEDQAFDKLRGRHWPPIRVPKSRCHHVLNETLFTISQLYLDTLRSFARLPWRWWFTGFVWFGS